MTPAGKIFETTPWPIVLPDSLNANFSPIF
jgi:hypothetical protein